MWAEMFPRLHRKCIFRFSNSHEMWAQNLRKFFNFLNHKSKYLNFFAFSFCQLSEFVSFLPFTKSVAFSGSQPQLEVSVPALCMGPVSSFMVNIKTQVLELYAHYPSNNCSCLPFALAFNSSLCGFCDLFLEP